MKILLIIFFGWPIILNGSTFAAIQGRFARQLDLTGAAIIPYVPWIALSVFIVGVVISGRSEKVWVKWVGFIAAILIGNSLIAYPVIIYNSGAHKISLSESPSRELRADFESRFNAKAVWYSNSSEGDLLVVREKDFSQDMVKFIESAEQVAASDPSPSSTAQSDRE